MKKLTKEQKKKIMKRINGVIFLLALATFIWGINSFWIGFHNVDLCHNEISIQNQLSEHLRTINKSFILRERKVFSDDVWSLKDCYLSGLQGIIAGFYISIIGGFWFGVCVGNE